MTPLARLRRHRASDLVTSLSPMAMTACAAGVLRSTGAARSAQMMSSNRFSALDDGVGCRIRLRPEVARVSQQAHAILRIRPVPMTNVVEKRAHRSNVTSGNSFARRELKYPLGVASSLRPSPNWPKARC